MTRLYRTLLEGGCSHTEQHEAGRALLRSVLGDAQVDRLEIAPGGRPYIPGGPDFSISHCDGLVLLAVSDAGRVGCDAEPLNRRIHNPEAIRKKLAPTAEEEHLTLLQLWTRREAIFKAGGAGEVTYPHVAEGYIVAVCESKI